MTFLNKLVSNYFELLSLENPVWDWTLQEAVRALEGSVTGRERQNLGAVKCGVVGQKEQRQRWFGH